MHIENWLVAKYHNGQFQGGMANIAISDRYPSLFTVQFLVACQWNTDEILTLW